MHGKGTLRQPFVSPDGADELRVQSMEEDDR